MATALSDRPVRIKVYKNGDITYPSKAIVLNKRYFRTFDGLLEDCTQKLKLNTPARDICTPTRGTRVQTLDTFQQDAAYVVCSTGPFKKLEYGDFKPSAHPPLATFKINEVRPVQHSRIQTSAKYKKIRNDVIKIFVYSNGNALEPAHPLTFTERELNNWEGVLSKITERVNLTSGAVRKLYDVEGQMITDSGQLDKNQFYVAVGAENRLKKLQYGSQRPLFSNSPRRDKQYKPHDPFVPQKRRRPQRPGDSTTTATTDTSPTASTVPSNQTSSTRSRRNKPQSRPRKEEDTVFHARPVKYKRSSEKSRRQADYDKDEGGVFKAKTGNSDVADAQEVAETRETKVDLPVDQMEAQEVQDEEIETEEKHRRRRSPTPAREPTPPRESTPPRRDKTMTPKPPSEAPQSRHSERRSLPPSRHSEKPPSRKSEKPASRESEKPVAEKPPSRQSEKPVSRQSEKPVSRQSEKPASRQSENSQENEKPQSRHSDKPASRQSEKPASRQSRRSNVSEKVEKDEEKDESTEEDDDVKEREEAATKIQAGVRGHKARKDLKEKRTEEEENNHDQSANQEEDNKSPEPDLANQDGEDKNDDVDEADSTNQEQDNAKEEPDEPAKQNEEDNRPESQNKDGAEESANQDADNKSDDGNKESKAEETSDESDEPKADERKTTPQNDDKKDDEK